MREIKFRAWDTLMNEMHYNGLLPNGEEMVLAIDGRLIFSGDSFKNSDFTLMQYTGLRDKNGKEIYEGDITKSPHGGIGTVEFHNSWGAFYYKTVIGKNEDGKLARMHSSVPFWNDAPKFEVIGNIYENPQLLEGSKPE